MREIFNFAQNKSARAGSQLQLGPTSPFQLDVSSTWRRPRVPFCSEALQDSNRANVFVFGEHLVAKMAPVRPISQR